MKVYEIVTEAPNVRRGILDPEITDVEPKDPSKTRAAAPKSSSGPSSSAFNQMANQLGAGTSSSGGTTTQTATGQVHTANPNNPNNPAKPSGPAAETPTKGKKPDIKELKKKLKPEQQQRATRLAEQKTAEFFGGKLVSYIGRKASIILPVLDWIEEMSTINVLFDQGSIDAKQAQNYRAAYSGACFTSMVTNWAAFLAFAKTSSTIITALRTALLGIPGAGWVAWTVTALTQTAFFALLNTETVQNYVCKLIMTQAWPAADWVGSMGELGVVDWADKVKDEIRDAAKEPGALGARGQQAKDSATQPPNATTPAPANKPATNTKPNAGQAAQPAGQTISGDDLMKSIGL